MKKKVLSLALFFVMLFTFAFPVSAADMEEITEPSVAADEGIEPLSNFAHYAIYSISVAGAVERGGKKVAVTPFYTETYGIAAFPNYVLPSQIRTGYNWYIVKVKGYFGGNTLHIYDLGNTDYGNFILPGQNGSLAEVTLEVPDFYPNPGLAFWIKNAYNTDIDNNFRILRNPI